MFTPIVSFCPHSPSSVIFIFITFQLDLPFFIEFLYINVQYLFASLWTCSSLFQTTSPEIILKHLISTTSIFLSSHSAPHDSSYKTVVVTTIHSNIYIISSRPSALIPNLLNFSQKLSTSPLMAHGSMSTPKLFCIF